MNRTILRLIEAPPRFVTNLARIRHGRPYAVLLGCALEVAVLLPFSIGSPTVTLGIPAAIALAVATAAAVLVGTLEGILVAEAGAIVFAVSVSRLHPGGLAALGVWPLLVLLAGLFADRVAALRAQLEDELAVAAEDARRWSFRLESLTEISSALAAEPELDALLPLVARSLRRLVGARAASVLLPGPDGVLRPAAVDGEPAGAEPDLQVPLTIGGDEIGALAVYGETGRDGARLAAVFAARAAASVQAARRAEEGALRKVVAAQEAERRRLALALHDGTAQELASALLLLGGADTGVVREQLVETLREVRRLSVELYPKALEDYGLEPALERLVESSAIEVDLHARLGGERLPAETEAALYRIVQEALANVARHAAARRASVVVALREGAVGAVVEDDGRGFDPAAHTEGLGLAAIRERVRLLGGALTVESTPGGGTAIAVELPLPAGFRAPRAGTPAA